MSSNSGSFNVSLTRSSFVRDIPHRPRRELYNILDVDDDWESLAHNILDKRSSRPRYEGLHIRVFGKENLRRGGSAARKLIEDWQTQLPTIQDFIDVLVSAELYNCVDFLHRLLGEHPFTPNRPLDPDLSTMEERREVMSFQTHPSFSEPGLKNGDNSAHDCLPSQSSAISEEMSQSLTSSHVKTYDYGDLEKWTACFDTELITNAGRLIGKGGYGEVFLGVIKDPASDSTEMVAVKKFHQSSIEYLKQFQKELDSIAISCEHPNLLRIKGVCVQPHFCVVYEFMSGGALDKKLVNPDEGDRLTANQRLSIAIDVAQGIQHLHSRTPQIVHRDIKSANILLDEHLHAKVGDFGLARVQSMVNNSYTNATTGIHGTTLYMPPESLSSSIVSDKWDVYSFGVVLLELLFGRGAVYEDSHGTHHKLMEYIFDEDEREVNPQDLVDQTCGWKPEVSNQLIELAENCANKKARRPDIHSVLEKLKLLQEIQMGTN